MDILLLHFWLSFAALLRLSKTLSSGGQPVPLLCPVFCIHSASFPACRFYGQNPSGPSLGSAQALWLLPASRVQGSIAAPLLYCGILSRLRRFNSAARGLPIRSALYSPSRSPRAGATAFPPSTRCIYIKGFVQCWALPSFAGLPPRCA